MNGAAPRGPHELSREASGLRHLRWAREIAGSLIGLAAFEGALTDAQKACLQGEIARVTGMVTALSAAVKPYRDFLERTRTLARGRVRAAEIVAKGALGALLEEASREGAAALQAASGELFGAVETERRELKTALSKAIDDVRAGLRAMDERLLGSFSREVVGALYPPLAPDGMCVLDAGDPDDDATAAFALPRALGPS